jgi:pyrroloquinoline quinone (PQQ) biosynthesis protein C
MTTGTPPTTDLVAALHNSTEETLAALMADETFRTVFDGTTTRELYLEFLARTYHYVTYTSYQLEEGKKLTATAPDPFQKAMHERFDHHAKEESGHELWVLDDIQALGGDVEAVKRGDPGLAVKAYAAMVQLVLRSKTPLGIIGVGALLEGISARLGTMAANNLRKHSKIPNIENALKFFDSHGEADREHIIEQNTTLAGIPSEEDRRAIRLCIETTAFQYRNLFA